MSRSYARNGTTKRQCVHCFVCHSEKLFHLPLHRDRKRQLDVIELEIERYFAERVLYSPQVGSGFPGRR